MVSLILGMEVALLSSPADQEDQARVLGSFQAGSRASNARAMEKVASS